MKKFPLGTSGSKGAMILDDQDFYILAAYGRTIGVRPNGYTYIQNFYSRGRHVSIHRLIAARVWGPIPQGKEVDHVDGNKLNNRRDNLRIVSTRQNQQNQYKHRNGKLAGANFHRKTKKWQACVSIEGKQVYLGLFLTEELAHAAYLHAANAIEKRQEQLQ